ncbi:helix-turn-helix domain-containing protein [Pseudonocardia sp. CA-142604]|uniref:AraC-like ligand-binding domain-containing protein n=1 Tax=Pseudonocardia sp. CA-142604 TaxID=3240024 RepID=UPI003D8D31DA
MQLSLDLRQIPAEDRLDVWRSAAAASFVPVEIVAGGDGSLSSATMRSHDVGDLRVCDLRAGAGRVVRDRRLAEDASGDYVIVDVQRSGSCLLVQDGREALLNPGDIVCYQTTRPYSLFYEGPFRQSLVRIPRALLASPEALLDDARANVIPAGTGIGRLLVPLLTSLATDAENYTGPGEYELADAVVELFSAAIIERRARAAGNTSGPSAVREMLRARIQRFVEEQLADPDLGPRSVAAAHNISVRYLHKLYAEAGTTFGGALRRLRLQAAARELHRPHAAHLTIEAVARHCGFTDAAHFSKVFTRAYGTNPREWRARATSGKLHTSTTRPPKPTPAYHDRKP